MPLQPKGLPAQKKTYIYFFYLRGISDSRSLQAPEDDRFLRILWGIMGFCKNLIYTKFTLIMKMFLT